MQRIVVQLTRVSQVFLTTGVSFVIVVEKKKKLISKRVENDLSAYSFIGVKCKDIGLNWKKNSELASH